MPSLKQVDLTTFPKTGGTTLQQNFIIYATVEIIKINLLIDDYKAITHSDDLMQNTQKMELLHQINDLRKNLDDNYPQELTISAFKDEIQVNLFKGLQEEFALLGIDSMHESVLNSHRSPQNSSAPISTIDPFSTFIANMDPEKGSKMLAILSTSPFDKTAFKSLFTESKELAIKDSYDITLLGSGGGNSINFTLTDLTDPNKPIRILKVDNRLGNARNIDTYIRNVAIIRDVFTPTDASRTLTYTSNKGEECTRTLLITELCAGGDPMAYATNQSFPTDRDRIKSAINIYSQMGDILMGIKNAGCLFPDMKNSNWLINEHGHVRIADTKSFLYAENGQYTSNQKLNQWLDFDGIITTKALNPPELFRDTSRSVDKLHSFMLGKNLYQYLTDCDTDDLKDKKDASQLNFDLPIFKTPEGMALHALISEMIKPKPKDRININDAMANLRDPLSALKPKCAAIIADIRQLNTTYNRQDDPLIIQEEKKLLSNTIDLSSATNLQKNLNALKKEAYKQIVSEQIANIRAELKPGDVIHKELDLYNKTLQNITSYAELEAMLTTLDNTLVTLKTQCTLYNNLVTQIGGLQSMIITWPALKQRLNELTQQHLPQLLTLTVKKRVDGADFIQACNNNLTNLQKFLKSYDERLATEITRQINDIGKYKVSQNDTLMSQFIASQEECLKQAKDVSSKEQLKKTLTDALIAVKSSQKIVEYATLLQDKTGNFKALAKEKGDAIITALAQVPIAERGKIGETADNLINDPIKEVQRAIATRRGYLRNIPPSNHSDAITKASFIKIKDQLKKMKQDADKPKTGNNVESTPTNRGPK